MGRSIQNFASFSLLAGPLMNKDTAGGSFIARFCALGDQ